jgi:hypothetical protein
MSPAGQPKRKKTDKRTPLKVDNEDEDDIGGSENKTEEAPAEAAAAIATAGPPAKKKPPPRRGSGETAKAAGGGAFVEFKPRAPSSLVVVGGDGTVRGSKGQTQSLEELNEMAAALIRDGDVDAATKQKQMGVIYSRRKRVRQKIRVETLQAQKEDLLLRNRALAIENERLEYMIRESMGRAAVAAERHRQYYPYGGVEYPEGGKASGGGPGPHQGYAGYYGGGMPGHSMGRPAPPPPPRPYPMMMRGPPVPPGAGFFGSPPPGPGGYHGGMSPEFMSFGPPPPHHHRGYIGGWEGAGAPPPTGQHQQQQELPSSSSPA